MSTTTTYPRASRDPHGLTMGLWQVDTYDLRGRLIASEQISADAIPVEIARLRPHETLFARSVHDRSTITAWGSEGAEAADRAREPSVLQQLARELEERRIERKREIGGAS